MELIGHDSFAGVSKIFAVMWFCHGLSGNQENLAHPPSTDNDHATVKF